MAVIKRNTHNDYGNKKNQVVSIEAACFVSDLKLAQHISLGCAHREFYFLFLTGEHLLNGQPWTLFLFIKKIKETDFK